MKKNIKKLVLKKETLRDLTPRNADRVKGGGKEDHTARCAGTKRCPTVINC